MNKTVLILFTALIFSCTKPIERLNGHWVSKEFFEGTSFFTVDFEPDDSLIFFNRNSLGSWNFAASYFEENGKGEFFYAHSATGKFESVGDSLIFSSDDFSSSLVKIDESKTFYKGLFIGIDLDIALPEVNDPEGSIFHETKNFINISIGTPIFELAAEFPDSTFIQVYDIFLPEKELPTFIKRATDGFPEHIRNDVIIRINADRNVREEFLSRIISNSQGLRVWRTYFDKKGNRLGYKQLSGDPNETSGK